MIIKDTFIKCFVCGGPLRYEYNNIQTRQTGKTNIFKTVGVVTRDCTKYINHNISISSIAENDQLTRIVMLIDANTRQHVSIDFVNDVIEVYTMGMTLRRDCVNIPFFEPDFSSYPKLIKKIKNAVLFS